MRVNNMKHLNRERNEFEATVQWDVKSLGVRAVTERAHTLLCGVCPSSSACMEVSGESTDVTLHRHCLTYCKIK
jgi:hypothetical protein